MARTTLSQKVVVNLHLHDIAKKRPRRKRQSQIQLNRQSGLRMIPTMFPVYINPSVQNPLATYGGTHQVDADVRVRPSQIEHPGLMTRAPVMPDPERVSDAMAQASQVQHQIPGKPEVKKETKPHGLTGLHTRYRSPYQPQVHTDPTTGRRWVRDSTTGELRPYTGAGRDTPSS